MKLKPNRTIGRVLTRAEARALIFGLAAEIFAKPLFPNRAIKPRGRLKRKKAPR